MTYRVSKCTERLAGVPLLAVAAVAFAVCPAYSAALPATVECNVAADTLGTAIAVGGDFDGDGVDDIAVAAPCVRIRRLNHVGRVFIRSGATGKIIRRVKGKQAEEFFGTSVAFIGDVNGDGRNELAVGAPSFDPLNTLLPGETITDAGLVQVFSKRGRKAIRTVLGTTQNENFGVSVAGISDVDQDNIPDFVVGATGARDKKDNKRKGGAFFLSGADGTLINSIVGRKNRQKMGQTIINVGRADGDAIDDVLVTSERNPAGFVKNGGFLEIRSGASVEDAILGVGGSRNDRLGASVAAAREKTDGDRNGQFIVGAPGTRVQTIKGAGLAISYSAAGNILFAVSDTMLQRGAGFGAGVAAIGDINLDGVTDFAASAPLFDSLVDPDLGLFSPDVGRIVALSGVDGSPLWTHNGTLLNTRFGQTLAGGIDYNHDGVPDLLSGNPGDAPKGRRGAGTVKILSGLDGRELASFKGRQGLETRIFTLAKPAGAAPQVLSFGPSGNRAEVRASVLGDARTGTLSVAVLGDDLSSLKPGGLRLAVGTGRGGQDPVVSVLSASRRSKVFSSFDAFAAPYSGGVNVASGDLDNDGRTEIVVVQSDSSDGNVDVAIFTQPFPDPLGVGGWLLVGTFRAFSGGDTINPGVPIEAQGGTAAVGNLTSAKGREILIGTSSGTPLVRVFTSVGNRALQWIVYDNQQFSGVNVAIGDLDGDGNNEIVTAPGRGRAWIRAFTGKGQPFVPPGAIDPVSFLAFPESFAGGARVTTADIDFDGRDEILVVPGSGNPTRVLAFEPDGTAVEGWKVLRPFNSAVGNEIAIAATNRFVRR